MVHSFNHSKIINMSFTKEQRVNLLCSALEGGSNYWYFIGQQGSDAVYRHGKDGDTFVDRMYAALEAGENIEVKEDSEDGDVLGSISMASIEAGEQIMHDQYGAHYGDVLAENDDATTGDVWFQLAVMADVVYG